MKFALIAVVGMALAQEEPEVKSWNWKKEGKEGTGRTIKDTTSKITEMRNKFTDYFAYEFKAMNITSADAAQIDAQCNLNSDCSDSNEVQKCCVHTTMYHKDTDTKDVSYKCMSKGLVKSNIDLTLGDFSVDMKCMSGAVALATAVASVAAVTATLI